MMALIQAYVLGILVRMLRTIYGTVAPPLHVGSGILPECARLTHYTIEVLVLGHYFFHKVSIL